LRPNGRFPKQNRWPQIGYAGKSQARRKTQLNKQQMKKDYKRETECRRPVDGRRSGSQNFLQNCVYFGCGDLERHCLPGLEHPSTLSVRKVTLVRVDSQRLGLHVANASELECFNNSLDFLIGLCLELKRFSGLILDDITF
jgi:hypothetical protein